MTQTTPQNQSSQQKRNTNNKRFSLAHTGKMLSQIVFWGLILNLFLSGCWKNPVPQETSELQNAIDTFQRLRIQESHFEGGEYNPKIDPFESEMHLAMLVIEKAFKEKSLSPQGLKMQLGEPDATQDQEGAPRWIYFWRGWHDYLYFEIADEKVTRVGWFFAGE